MDSNDEGSILFANSLIGPPCEPDIEEATAAFLAVQTARELKLDKIILEGDSLAVTLTSYWKISSLYAQLPLDSGKDLPLCFGFCCCFSLFSRNR